MTALFSFGLGIGTQNNNSEWLEVFYPQPLLAPNETVKNVLAENLGYTGGNQTLTLDSVALENWQRRSLRLVKIRFPPSLISLNTLKNLQLQVF